MEKSKKLEKISYKRNDNENSSIYIIKTISQKYGIKGLIYYFNIK